MSSAYRMFTEKPDFPVVTDNCTMIGSKKYCEIQVPPPRKFDGEDTFLSVGIMLAFVVIALAIFLPWWERRRKKK